MLNCVGEGEKTTLSANHRSKILGDLRVTAALDFRAKAIDLLEKAMRILFIAQVEKVTGSTLTKA